MSDNALPIRYVVDKAQKFVWSDYTATIGDAELLGHQERLRNDPRVEDDFDHVVDCRNVDSVAVTPHGLRRAAQARFSPSARIAVVAPQSVVYGLARMFEAYGAGPGAGALAIFSTAREASEWLGITPPEGYE
jgi:hypothetical protein